MPTNIKALKELAERAASGIGEDRELDGLICAHLTWNRSIIVGNEPGRFPQKPIYGSPLDLIDVREFWDYINAPRYTVSADAALSLYETLPEMVSSNPRLIVADALNQLIA